MTILFDSSSSAEAIARSLRPEAVIATSVADVEALLRSSDHDLVVVGPEVDHTAACALAASQRWGGSAVGVVLTRHRLESAVLREAMVAGVRDVVAVDDLDGLAQACQRSLAVTQQLRQAQPSARASEQPTGEIVTVFASKGGCGKTTLATNLATAFARSGRRTCLVDLDLAFGDVAITMQLQPQRTIADALGLSALDGTAVRSLVTTHSSGVDAILAPVEPGTAEAVSAELIGDLLEVLKTLYDVVVLDTPPAFTEHVLAAFDRADHSVLITTLDIPALKNLKLTLETLDMLGYPRDRWRVVLNRSDAKVGLSVQDVERTLRTRITTQVPSSRAVPASINRGVPIVLDQPGHPVSLAVRRLAESLTKKPTAKPAAARPVNRLGFSLRRKAEVTP